nr:hypothetical protein [Tanacetum cinerariifolium]
MNQNFFEPNPCYEPNSSSFDQPSQSFVTQQIPQRSNEDIRLEMEYLENFSNAITPVLPAEEPEYSLSIGYEHPSTILKTESDEVIKSNVKNFVPIQSEYEASLLESELVSLEEENDVYQEEKDIDLEDILQIQDVIPREKLLSINRLFADIEFLNDNPTPDRVLKSSSSFPIFEKFDNSLSYSNNSLPEFETFNEHMEETRSGSTTAHANNSPPEYDSFCFDIELGQGRLTSIVMKDISDNSTNDPLLEEVDLFLASDNSIPPDVEFFFDFEPNSGELISAVINNIDELNEDECFDPGGGEIDDFENIEDDD